jgi:hypothetical protein
MGNKGCRCRQYYFSQPLFDSMAVERWTRLIVALMAVRAQGNVCPTCGPLLDKAEAPGATDEDKEAARAPLLLLYERVRGMNPTSSIWSRSVILHVLF